MRAADETNAAVHEDREESRDEGATVPLAPKYRQVQTPSEGEAANAPVSAEEQQAREESAEDLMHGVNSFWAVIWPVCVTMVIARYVYWFLNYLINGILSIAVVNCRSRALERSMSSYLVYNEVKGAEAGQVVGHSLVNALVVIGFVTVLTFVMALLYKFNCMRVCFICIKNIRTGFIGTCWIYYVLLVSYSWFRWWSTCRYNQPNVS